VEERVLADDLGEVQLHGFTRPVHAYRLLDLRGAGTGE
jgi:class 3 adenylate cyclase